MQVIPYGHGGNTVRAWTGHRHYRTFKGIMASTGAERLSDTVRFKHHAITTPHLNPADIILEAARQLHSVIKKHPKKSPMDELFAIELLRKVLLGEKKIKTPPQQRSSIKNKKHCHRPRDVFQKSSKKKQKIISARQTRWPHCMLSSKIDSIHPRLNNQQ